MSTRVLLIEDEPMLQRLLRRMLATHCTVTVAQTIDEALDEIGLLDFDVVVADLELGEKHRNGCWVLEQVETRQPGARRLLISAHHHALRASIDELHAHATLAKPFSQKELLAALRARPTSTTPASPAQSPRA